LSRAARARAKKSKPTRDATEVRGDVLEVLRELLAEGRSAEIEGLVRKLLSRNSELERLLAMVKTKGRKNERISRDQLLLFMDALGAPEAPKGQDEEKDDGAPELGAADEKLRDASGIDDEAAEQAALDRTTSPPAQPPVRKPPPAHLPRVDNPVKVPPEQRACPKCGAERTCIGHEVTEVIELIPAKVIVRRDLVEKLACKPCDGEFVRAEAGDKVVVGGKLGTRLVAQVVVDKYDDGLPLHRQKQRFARMGLDLSISTMADQVTWSTDLLRPVWRAALAAVLAANVMHLDGTSLPVLDRDAAAGKRLGALWGYVGDTNVAAYLYTSTGKKEGQRPGELGPQDMLLLRQGYTVADASNLFDEGFKRPDIVECGCNMHARRYFVKALDGGDKRAALPIAAYRKLYEIEAEVRGKPPDQVLAERQSKSRPVFEELVTWARAYEPHEPPSSPLGEAIRYLLNHREALGRFLEDGAIPPDNGIVERLHVRAALTRKNFLFAGSDAGGDRAAIAFTILSCCRLAEVDPVEYLADVLPRLAKKIRLRVMPDLLPAAWKVARTETAVSAPTAAAPVAAIAVDA
jgi:transposase